MYVYVTKFKGQPNLLKIGKSMVPESRNADLSNTHGPVVHSGHYLIGDEYSKVERELHKRYAGKRERIIGDGGTEFFSDSIYEDVCSYLDKYRLRSSQLINEEVIRAQIKVESKRYYNLIGKLLGYGNCDLHTGESHSSYVGMWDMIKIDNCYDMGFPPDDIHKKYILKSGMERSKAGFTTPGRVGIAHKLATEGTEKSRELRKLLAEVVKSNESLPS